MMRKIARKRWLITTGCFLALIFSSIACILLFFDIANGGKMTGFNNVIFDAHPDIAADKILAHTNRERVAAGKAELTLNYKLTKAAHLKAQDMLARQYWSHNDPDGIPPWKWVNDMGYNYAVAGENLARGFRSANDVVAAWMDSPAHKINVLHSAYTEVGFASVDGQLHGKDTTLVVALYAKPAKYHTLANALSDSPGISLVIFCICLIFAILCAVALVVVICKWQKESKAA
ncbi:MAG: CAP domain-containing protein [Candidatus Nomurabacteria bacterium]|jgi:hypothetical protein|nr:CAP domain-containing protein [Candidatus Nomurabacteria bacterium]